MVKRMKTRTWLLLVALAVFACLWLASSEPAYADGAGDESHWPGEGGEYNPSYRLEGWVLASGESVQGVKVYIYYAWQAFEVVTNGSGYWKFEADWLSPNSSYVVTVNGIDYNLGVCCDNPRYGQWRGCITTNERAYGWKIIYTERSAEVNVPAAALFSNTQYATLRYEATFSHTMTFNVAFGGISTGYTTSESTSAGFEVAPTYASYWRRPHYAATYWDDFTDYTGEPYGIRKTGIAGAVPNTFWGSAPTQEYIDPNSLEQGYFDFPCARGTMEWYHYKETGSHTWSVSSGVSFAITYQAYGISIGLDVTVAVTSSTESWVAFEVDRRSEASPDIRMFRAYAPGWPLNPSKNPGQGVGGVELHIWEIGAA